MVSGVFLCLGTPKKNLLVVLFFLDRDHMGVSQNWWFPFGFPNPSNKGSPFLGNSPINPETCACSVTATCSEKTSSCDQKLQKALLKLAESKGEVSETGCVYSSRGVFDHGLTQTVFPPTSLLHKCSLC